MKTLRLLLVIFLACGSLHSCIMEISPEELEQYEIERAIEEGRYIKIHLWKRCEEMLQNSRYYEQENIMNNEESNFYESETETIGR